MRFAATFDTDEGHNLVEFAAPGLRAVFVVGYDMDRRTGAIVPTYADERHLEVDLARMDPALRAHLDDGALAFDDAAVEIAKLDRYGQFVVDLTDGGAFLVAGPVGVDEAQAVADGRPMEAS